MYSKFLLRLKLLLSKLDQMIRSVLFGTIVGKLPFNCILSVAANQFTTKKFNEHIESIKKVHSLEVVRLTKDLEFPNWVEPEYVLNERYIIEVRNSTVYPLSGAVVLGSGEVLVESVGSLYKLLAYGRFNVEAIRLPGRKKDIACGTPVPGGHGGPFHWLFESLPSALRCRELFPDASLIVPAVRSGYVDQILEIAFGKNVTEKIISANSGVRCEKAWFYSKSHGSQNLHPEDVCLVRRHLLDALGIEPNGVRRIYISRRLAKKRSVNEERIEELFTKLGFEIVFPETLPYQAQIRLFAESCEIAGMHGAGFSNIAFAAKGSLVIELFLPNYLNDCYVRLSSLLGLKHSAIICKSDDSHFSLVENIVKMHRSGVDKL